MKLTEFQRTQLRGQLLHDMHQVYPGGMVADMLLQGAILRGFSALTLDDLRPELACLVAEGYATEGHLPFNKAAKTYARTEDGRVLLVEAGLIA
jgi:hypothetical protein